MQAAGLIGKYVLVAGSNIALANGQSAGGVQLKEAADQVTVNVLDGAGNVVQSQQLGRTTPETRIFLGWQEE